MTCVKILELKEEGKIKPKQSNQLQDEDVTPLSANATPLEKMRAQTKKLTSRSVGDEYADKLGSKLGGRKGRQVGRMIGIDVPVTSSTATTSSSSDSSTASEEVVKRKPKLGTLDVEDLEDDDDDDDYVYEVEMTEEQRREQSVIDSKAASDAISALRRNVDKDVKASGMEEEEEMDEESMVDAVAEALARTGGAGFRSRASLDILESEEETIASPPPQSIVGATEDVSSASVTSSTGKFLLGVCLFLHGIICKSNPHIFGDTKHHFPNFIYLHSIHRTSNFWCRWSMVTTKGNYPRRRLSTKGGYMGRLPPST